ncbi:MAG TPA: hypothetical protein VJ249_04595 [Candidatus Bathyarchaeia archaeon]|nr:hypothetical protein [Candidatus Bathyarchaeia archaeon]
METEKPEDKVVHVPQEFRIESFQWLKDKMGVQESSVERLSLPRIINATKKHAPHTLKRVEEYYVQVGWLLAAAELAKQLPSVEALERAERYYAKSCFYRSAAEVAEKIGTPEALKRAKEYRKTTC